MQTWRHAHLAAHAAAAADDEEEQKGDKDQSCNDNRCKAARDCALPCLRVGGIPVISCDGGTRLQASCFNLLAARAAVHALYSVHW